VLREQDGSREGEDDPWGNRDTNPHCRSFGDSPPKIAGDKTGATW